MIHDPPGRSTAWRHGFNTPINNEDNELFCGGFENQWRVNAGRCGVCGDPYQGPREHEAGGKYASGTIVRTYQTGQVIPVYVQLTANHEGWFEFRMCENNDVHKAITQECLDEHLLELADGSGTRYKITSDMYHVQTKLRLPEGVQCEQCVIQWLYNAGNKWGYDPTTKQRGLGFGAQEQFLGCSDIAINDKAPVIEEIQVPQQQDVTTPAAQLPCRGVGRWAANQKQAEWCTVNCGIGHCPADLCVCDN